MVNEKQFKKNFSIFALIIILVIIIDQLSKFIIINFINIDYVTNTGSLFGLFEGSAIFLSWFTIIVIGSFIAFFNNIQKLGFIAISASGLIVGGAIGNLIDRIIYGYVIDFIDLGFWPSFNIADSGISVGIILLCIIIYLEDKKNKANI